MFKPPDAFIKSSEARQAMIKQKRISGGGETLEEPKKDLDISDSSKDEYLPHTSEEDDYGFEEEQPLRSERGISKLPPLQPGSSPITNSQMRTQQIQKQNGNKTRQEIDRIKAEREDRRKKNAKLRKMKDELSPEDRQHFTYKLLIQRFREQLLGPAGGDSDGNADTEDEKHRKSSNIWLNQTGEDDEEILKIIVRKRPPDQKEIDSNLFDILTVDTRSEDGHDDTRQRSIYVHEPKSALNLTQSIDNHRFVFDRAYGEDSSNEQIYLDCMSTMADEFLTGNVSCTFIAYGQTGSGKTHTVFGNRKDAGVISMLIQKLLESVEESDYALSLSFYEIYSNKIYDLLQDRRQVSLLESKNGTCVIQGLREVICTSLDQCLDTLATGMGERITAATEANAQSSRSHAVLLLKLVPRYVLELTERERFQRQRELEQSSSDERQHVFAVVDLAGSEKASETNARDRITMMEGAEINKSLLALKECIRALNASKQAAFTGKAIHVPFRASKLTMVLRDSLDSAPVISQNRRRKFNTMVLMCATVRPTNDVAEHSLNTLRYAQRLKEVTKQISSVTSFTLDKLQINNPMELASAVVQQSVISPPNKGNSPPALKNKLPSPKQPPRNKIPSNSVASNEDVSTSAKKSNSFSSSPKSSSTRKASNSSDNNPHISDEDDINARKPRSNSKPSQRSQENFLDETQDSKNHRLSQELESLMLFHLQSLGKLLKISHSKEEKWLAQDIDPSQAAEYLLDLQQSILDKQKLLAQLQDNLDRYKSKFTKTNS